MKTTVLALAVFTAFFAYSCAADEGYNTQKGAAIGAIGGAIAGQAIGHNTAGTLIGAAGGALVGAVAGNAVDQSQAQQRLAQQQPPPPPVYAGPPPPPEGPPGQWVDVPGQWVNGQWVPPHRAWVPANPPPGEFVATAPPAYEIAAPPDMVLIPGTYVYFVPGIEADILFYHGLWYRHFRGRWWEARFYNGPWAFTPGPRVPRALIALPPGWRRIPPGYRPIPHAELQRNWARWERERHWEHH